MTRDPLDDFATKLFDAAHDEPAPRGAVERAVTAAGRARPTPAQRRASARNRLALGVGLAVAAGVALSFWHASPSERANITAEPTPVTPVTPEPHKASPEPEQVPPSPHPDNLREVPAAPLPRRTPAPSAAPQSSGATSLADELDTLKRAETALGAGDSKAALDALDRYEHVLHGQQMRAEAALLRMDALSRSGHAEQAAALAQRFVAENPGSPLVDRARSFLKNPEAP